MDDAGAQPVPGDGDRPSVDADDVAVTLRGRWAAIEPMADTIASRPETTIRPEIGPDTAGRQAMAALQRLAALGGSPEAELDIEATLGEGGMGVVRLATQRSMGRKVAVKTVRDELISEQATLKLLQEAWVTGALEHPNVVPVYDVGFDAQGRPQIVLKRIGGVRWEDLLLDDKAVRDRFGERDLLEWNLRVLMQVCNAVSFAHSRGILHRDIKPENVMIGEFGEIYVLDWGIAVSVRDDDSGRLPLAKHAREIAGTPAYMAPEQLGGAPLTERTDVYLLGATLYDLMAGHPPHQGDNAMQIVHAVATSEPAMPDHAPLELARICRRAMDRDPDARFENVEQLRLAIQGYLQHRGSALICEEAEERLAELTERLARGAPGEGEDEHLAVYNLYGECRFGFREALRAWRGNEAARDGLRRATITMVEYEIGQGDPRAAARLMADLDEPPEELARALDKASADREAEQRRIARLEELDKDLDTTVGARTRTFLALIMGGMWTLGPLLVPHLPLEESYPRVISVYGMFLALGAGAAYWARESMLKTALNRRLLWYICLAIAGPMVLALGAWGMGYPPGDSQRLSMLLWALIAAVAATTTDVRFLPTCFVFVVGFFVTVRWPDLRYEVISFCNLLFVINMVVVWKPLFTIRRNVR